MRTIVSIILGSLVFLCQIYTASAQVQTKIVDKSGNTRFHYLIIEGGEFIGGSGDNLAKAFDKWPRKDGSTLEVLKAWEDCTEKDFWGKVFPDKVNKLQEQAEPGDEVVIAYLGHGGGGEGVGVEDKNDPNEQEKFDNHITLTRSAKDCKNATLTDDKLSTILSGFKKSVTLIVFVGSCFGGSFKDDLGRAKNKDGEEYGSHLFTIGPSGETEFGPFSLEEAVKDDDKNGFPDADSDGNSVLTTDEFETFFKNFPDTDVPEQQSHARSSFPEPACALPQIAHLAINMRDHPDPVRVGSNLTYTVRVANTGSATVTGVQVTDTLPKGVNSVSASSGCSQSGRTITCRIPSLAPDEKATLQITVQPTVPGGLRNTVSVTANEHPRREDIARTRVIP